MKLTADGNAAADKLDAAQKQKEGNPLPETHIKTGDVSVGDTVYFTDVRDETKRIPGNFRGFNGDQVVVVYDGGKQMSLPSDRVFKNDVVKEQKEAPVASEQKQVATPVEEGNPASEKVVVTKDIAANFKNGQVVEDEQGNKYLAHSARHGYLEVHPIIDGKAVVNNQSRITFHIDTATAAGYPERRHDRLFVTQRSAPEQAEAKPAAPAIDAKGAAARDRARAERVGFPDNPWRPGACRAWIPG